MHDQQNLFRMHAAARKIWWTIWNDWKYDSYRFLFRRKCKVAAIKTKEKRFNILSPQLAHFDSGLQHPITFLRILPNVTHAIEYGTTSSSLISFCLSTLPLSSCNLTSKNNFLYNNRNLTCRWRYCCLFSRFLRVCRGPVLMMEMGPEPYPVRVYCSSEPPLYVHTIYLFQQFLCWVMMLKFPILSNNRKDCECIPKIWDTSLPIAEIHTFLCRKYVGLFLA